MSGERLSPSELKRGILHNKRRLSEAKTNKLHWIYERVVPTGNIVTTVLEFPRSALVFWLEYITIGIPPNANLDNIYFTATNEKYGLRYMFENLRDGILGAKVNLFTTPGADKDTTLAGDQSSFQGMLPINLKFHGNEQSYLFLKGPGLGALSYIDILVTGHLVDRVAAGGGGYRAL